MTTSTDEFLSLLDKVSAALQIEQRLSYRGLKRRFGLDDEDLADIRAELVDARRTAVDENGSVLVWAGPPAQTGAIDERGLPARTRPTYTPKHLAERILSIRSAVTGEKKQVTVLFCDVANSMLLAERLGPEGWHETLNQFFAGLTDAVHRLDGTVNQYTGDGVMALFGAPIGHEDHAHRACMAALRIRDTTATLDARVFTECGLHFAVRIGLNSGEVVVGAIGDDLRMDYTAQGHVVGIAARLEGLAGGGRILLSEACRRHVDGLCRTREHGPERLKGVEQPVLVHELLSAQASANRFDTSRSRGLSRFIGRAEEIGRLESALAASRAGRGQVIGVVADAGTGKSRLFHEFLETCRARGMRVQVGRALAHSAHVPYLPLLQVFRSYFDIGDDDPPDTAREKIDLRLARVGTAAADTAPLVHELLGVADPARPAPIIDPDAKQRRLIGLMQAIVRGADPAGGSTITAFEDLHWMDAASERFLEAWVAAVADSDRLLLLNFRPGYYRPWMKAAHFTLLPLTPLDPAEVKVLVEHLVGADSGNLRLAEDIFQRSGGNPFFCEEIVQSLRESGLLILSGGRLQLRRPVGLMQIPASVQSVLAARIDRLADAEKSVLQVAAVIGREFSAELTRRVLDLSPEAFAPLLATLIQAEFVRPVSFGGSSDDLHMIKHALTQEVALISQLRERRRATHGLVAETLAVGQPTRMAETAALRAWHWEQAEEPAKAAQCHAEAAVAIRSGNRSQQLGHLHKVLTLTDTLPATPERQQLRLQCLVELIAGGAWRFSMTDADLDRYCDEARALAESFGLRELAMMIRAGRAAASGMMAGQIAVWTAAIGALAEECRAAPVAADAHGTIVGQYAYALYASGRLEEALPLGQECERLCNGDPRFGYAMGYSVLGAMTNCVALIQTARGELDAGLAKHREGIEVLASAGIVEELIWNECNIAETIQPRGLAPEHPLLQQVAARVEAGHARAEQVASDFTRGVAKRALMVLRLMQGRHADAERCAEDCLAHLRSRRAHLEVEARCMAYLADAQRGCGKIDEAIETARAALATSREREARYFEACAGLSLAQALIRRADPTARNEAAVLLDTLLGLAERIGARALLPQLHEAQARLAMDLDDADTAARLCRQALAGYRAVNADGHVARLAAAGGH